MIAAIMPCRGRKEQTVANVRRLMATAGGVDWHLYLAGGENEVGLIWKACSEADITGERVSMVTTAAQRVTYWQALEMVTRNTDAPLICNLANDLLPGRDWISRAFAEYRCCFGEGDGLLGFNDGIHDEGLSPHFLISRGLLNRFGGWPVWYSHEYGDAELCVRAQAMGVYSKAPWAVLYHDHPITGGDPDSVYAEGHASRDRDAQLFHERRRQGWPKV